MNFNFTEDPSSKDEIKCDACGAPIDIHYAYLLMRTFKCHMNEKCIIKVYKKIKKISSDFKLASTGASDYGYK